MQGQHFHLTQRNFYWWLLYKLFSYIWRISSDQNDTCRYCVFVKWFQHFKEKIKPCQFLGCFSLYWSITTLLIYVMVPPYWLVFCQPTNIGNSKSVKRCCSSPMQELEKEPYYIYILIYLATFNIYSCIFDHFTYSLLYLTTSIVVTCAAMKMYL